MSRRKAVAVSVVLAAVAVGAPVVVAARSEESIAQITAAWDELRKPSLTAPLEGSVEWGENGWHAELPCSAVLAAYQQPGAPVPEGAIVTAREGRVIIEDRYGASAVFAVGALQIPLEDGSTPPEPGECNYRIAASPTLTVVSAGVPPPIDGFHHVGCGIDIGGAPLNFSAYDAGDDTEVLFVRRRGDDAEELWDPSEGLLVTFASMSTMLALGKAGFDDPSSLNATTTDFEQVGDEFSFSVATDAGDVHVEATCTGSTYSVPELRILGPG